VPIRLVAHDPRWVEAYEKAEAQIRDALGSTASSVHHVGSTSIPDIDAKPVVDVLVLVDAYDPEAPYRDPLAALGFAFHHRDESHVFFKGSVDGVAFHVHVVEIGADDAQAMIVFANHLRAHPDEARRYQALKRQLAEEHDDTNVYAEAKSAYVHDVVRRAKQTPSCGRSA
jgi:GrpB-like predicted nucleotidyltransferase (UPF0157 family)